MSFDRFPQHLTLGALERRVASRVESFEREGYARRLWQRDPTLWGAEPQPEIEDRLGWLDLPRVMEDQAAPLTAFAEEVRAEGIEKVLLLGMGGSSLAPEVFSRTLASGKPPGLSVLDTTHPEAVSRASEATDPRRTLFLVSSKSGTTFETLSLFHHFWAFARLATKDAGRHFAAVTDPGTPLESLAKERGFRRVFNARPDVGGRYSALTRFGLVPAALAGADLAALLASAGRVARACSPDVPGPGNPGLALGAALGEAALAGRDKVTFLASPSLAAVPAWMEQLIAESTGKSGRGIVPVADEPLRRAQEYGPDRFFAVLSPRGEAGTEEAFLRSLEAAGHPVAEFRLDGPTELGGLFFLWEVAVAAAGSVIGIHPFNQPDVQLAKELAKKAMEEGAAGGADGGEPVPASDGSALPAALAGWCGAARPGDYACIQAYLAPAPSVWAALQSLREDLGRRTGCATTSGYGPRFLHSTGQLHKGGPNSGLFLQLVDEPGRQIPVPELGFTFNALIRAQAEGDYAALRRRGRRVLRVNLGPDAIAGIEALRQTLRG